MVTRSPSSAGRWHPGIAPSRHTSGSLLASCLPCATGGHIYGGATSPSRLIITVSNFFWTNAWPPYPSITGSASCSASISRWSTSPGRPMWWPTLSHAGMLRRTAWAASAPSQLRASTSSAASVTHRPSTQPWPPFTTKSEQGPEPRPGRSRTTWCSSTGASTSRPLRPCSRKLWPQSMMMDTRVCSVHGIGCTATSTFPTCAASCRTLCGAAPPVNALSQSTCYRRDSCRTPAATSDTIRSLG